MMTNTEDRKFVESLREGDKVFVYTFGGCGIGDTLAPREVKRVTKTTIVVETYNGNEKKFRKDNLEEQGRKFGRMYMGSSHDEIVEYKEPYISQYTRQLKEGKCSRIIRWLGEKKLKDLSDETLDAWYGILIRFEKKGEEPK